MGQSPIQPVLPPSPGQPGRRVSPVSRPNAVLARRLGRTIPLALAAGAILLFSPASPGRAQGTEAPARGRAAEGESFSPSSASQLGLADHLRRQGYVFYGAWWCPACRQQKSLFGQAAAQRVPYLECEKEEAERQRCNAAGIRAYPTWIKGGERREGVLSLEELQRWSGYRPSKATPAPAQP